MEKEQKETRIGAIDNVVKQMGLEENATAVAKLHELIFGDKAELEDAIKALEDFSGSDEDKIHERLGKLSMADLREIARIILVSPGKKKEEAVAAIWEFIQTPKDSGKKPRAKRAKKEEGEKKSKKKDEDEDEDEEDGGKKKKRVKKDKKKVDPEAPKRPQTAYFIFSAEKRPEIKKQLEEEGEKFTVADVAKRLGAAWKELSDEEKAPYSDQAKEKMGEYKEAMKEYEASGKKAAWEAKIAEEGGDEEKPKKKKAAPKKAAPKKKKEEEKEEEEEEEAPEEEKKMPTKEELEKQIKKIIEASRSSGDSAETISLKSIRTKLEEHFGRPLTELKNDIKQLVQGAMNQ